MWIQPVDPAIKKIVDAATSYQLRVSSNDGAAQRLRYETQRLSQYNREQDLLETFSGLRYRITTALQSAGYKINLVRKDQKTLVSDSSGLTLEDLGNLTDRNDQIDVLGMICDYEEGFIVKAATGWGKSYILCQVCQMLPSSRIAIVAPGKDITSMLFRKLKQRIRDVGLVGGGSSMVSRITVSTMESVHKLEGYNWDLLLFDEVHRAGGPVIANKLSEVFINTKCVGFSASPTGRTDGSDLVVESLFGPIAYEVSYQDSVDRGAVAPIKVKMYRIDVGPTVNSSNSTVINRNCLWRNSIRNKFIAKLAKQFPDDEQTLITVATAEHALRLRQYLPDYEVVFSTISNKYVLRDVYDGTLMPVKGLRNGQMMDGRRGRLSKDFEKGTLKKAIATGVWNTGVDFKHLQNLIRADGMGSAIQATQTPGRLSRTNDGKTHGMLIDFLDCFMKPLYARSRQRMKVYKAKGWDIDIMYDPDVSVETFSSYARRKST